MEERFLEAWDLIISRLGMPCGSMIVFTAILLLAYLIATKNRARLDEKYQLMYELGLEKYEFLKKFGEKEFERVYGPLKGYWRDRDDAGNFQSS